jgi:hypothetical protein
MRVVKYFDKVHGGAPSVAKGAPVFALKPKKAHGDATYQEVELQEELHKKKAAQPRRVVPPFRSEEEQRRIVEARDRRLEKEVEAQREIRIGAGPVLMDSIRKLAKVKSL